VVRLRASQYEFRFDQADGTVTWTERDRSYTAAVCVGDAPLRPDFTAGWWR
jgi:hypothetical protein